MRGKHSNHIRGRKHYRSNRLGASLTAEGYVKVKVGKAHPMADKNGWCYLHQLVAATALGRPLRLGELVHHDDEDKANNAWENLTVTTKSDHNAHHNAERGRDDLGRFKPAVSA